MTVENALIKADELQLLPSGNRENYEFELEYLVDELPVGASILQVGSMDGVRAIRLMRRRPDLHFTGLDIDPSLVELARQNVVEAGVNASFVLGDICMPPDLPSYDYVLCLNHTLGYISDWRTAISNMRRLGGVVVVSVYTEAFDDSSAEYFALLGMPVDGVADGAFVLTNGWNIHKFAWSDLDELGGSSIQTPIGRLISFVQ